MWKARGASAGCVWDTTSSPPGLPGLAITGQLRASCTFVSNHTFGKNNPPDTGTTEAPSRSGFVQWLCVFPRFRTERPLVCTQGGPLSSRGNQVLEGPAHLST